MHIGNSKDCFGILVYEFADLAVHMEWVECDVLERYESGGEK